MKIVVPSVYMSEGIADCCLMLVEGPIDGTNTQMCPHVQVVLILVTSIQHTTWMHAIFLLVTEIVPDTRSEAVRNSSL